MDTSFDRKKLAAAAAVLAYIQTEEEAVCANAAISAASAAAPAPAEKPGPGPYARPASMWGVSGRMEQMRMGSMMQMRAFR